MRQIGGENANIDGSYETKYDDEEGVANMDEDEDDLLHPLKPGTRRTRRRGVATNTHTTCSV